MSLYRKKPIVIHAQQQSQPFHVQTLEGLIQGKAGDYLVTGIKGEQYPCDRSIFEQSYEEVILTERWPRDIDAVAERV